MSSTGPRGRMIYKGKAMRGGTAVPRYACQPWALRTAIIVLRMSFQVCGFIIVALGNMQPSQQMCWKALDG